MLLLFICTVLDAFVYVCLDECVFVFLFVYIHFLPNLIKRTLEYLFSYYKLPVVTRKLAKAT